MGALPCDQNWFALDNICAKNKPNINVDSLLDAHRTRWNTRCVDNQGIRSGLSNGEIGQSKGKSGKYGSEEHDR